MARITNGEDRCSDRYSKSQYRIATVEKYLQYLESTSTVPGGTRSLSGTRADVPAVLYYIVVEL
eukprot:SAG11_NODE_915_length_6553_cov_6.900728_1_plen_64_part_00